MSTRSMLLLLLFKIKKKKMSLSRANNLDWFIMEFFHSVSYIPYTGFNAYSHDSAVTGPLFSKEKKLKKYTLYFLRFYMYCYYRFHYILNSIGTIKISYYINVFNKGFRIGNYHQHFDKIYTEWGLFSWVKPLLFTFDFQLAT